MSKTKEDKLPPTVTQKTVDSLVYAQTYCNLLSGDIYDNYNDLRLRKIDLHERKYVHDRVNETIQSPHLEELLENVEGGKIREAYVVPSSDIKTRMQSETNVYFDMETIDGRKFPEDLYERTQLELDYFMTIAEFLSNEEWYDDLGANDRLAAKKTGEPVRLNIKVCFSGIVPDEVVLGMHYRACTTLCPFLEPLVFFWQNLMTDSFTVKKYVKELPQGGIWMPVERTALLVIHFLQMCDFLPNILKNVSHFDRDVITWQDVKDWDAGKPFFSSDIYELTKRQAAQSKVASFNIGEMFSALIDFYVHIRPLKTQEFDFDLGTCRTSKKTGNFLVIKTKLVQFPTPDEDLFPDKMTYCELLSGFVKEFKNAQSRTPGAELFAIRRKIQFPCQTSCTIPATPENAAKVKGCITTKK